MIVCLGFCRTVDFFFFYISYLFFFLHFRILELRKRQKLIHYENWFHCV